WAPCGAAAGAMAAAGAAATTSTSITTIISIATPTSTAATEPISVLETAVPATRGNTILSTVAVRLMQIAAPQTGLAEPPEATPLRIGKPTLGNKSAGRAAICQAVSAPVQRTVLSEERAEPERAELEIVLEIEPERVE